jgi:pSer/pThr/pTyr-binding forkhead associated (FHA) protein
MQQCPNCGHNNRAGIVFCENCGASLIGKMPLDTKSLDSSSEEEKAQIGVEDSVLTDVKIQGTGVFAEGGMLRLGIEGSPDPILFKPKAETIFGRRDPATGAMPDIDLTPFAGYRMGVSRRHAAIRFGEGQTLDLWDLGSSNGTFLNGTRLSAHRPYRLHDGDEIRLGQMMIRVYFEVAEEAAPVSDKTPATAPSAPVPPAEAPKSAAKPEVTAPQAEAKEPKAAAPQAQEASKPNAEPEAKAPAAEEQSARLPQTEPLGEESGEKQAEAKPADSAPAESKAEVTKPPEAPEKAEAKTDAPQAEVPESPPAPPPKPEEKPLPSEEEKKPPSSEAEGEQKRD